MHKVMLELFVSRYLLTDERTNADRDHKSLSKTHKIDTHSNHRLKLNCAMVTLVISPFLLSPLTHSLPVILQEEKNHWNYVS